MTSTQEHIRSVFDSLMQETGVPGQRVHMRIDKSSPINVYAACTFPHKNLTLEIGPIKNLLLPQGYKKPRIKGITISIDTAEKVPGNNVIFLMGLQQNEAVDIFSIFVAKVCDELDQLDNQEKAVRSVIALIEKWKEFFSAASEVLSDERQTGLYGELYLIRYFSLLGIKVGYLVNAWSGCKKKNQDFEFGSVAVEVKSSVAVDASRINITNSRQLDDTGLEYLLLARLVFEARQGSEHTLPGIIEFIRKDIQENSPEVSMEFEEKILKAGYREKHAENYNNREYSDREITFYRVIDDFPRLLEKDLPESITKISYELIVDMCRDFELDLEKVTGIVSDCCDRKS